MDINENNSYINSFTKGMNSDQTYDQLLNQQYTYAKNIRITKNQLVGDVDEDYSTLHEGIISPVHKGFELEDITHDLQFVEGFVILATATVDDMGIIVGKYDSRLQIYRFKILSVGGKDKIVDFVDWLSTDIHSEINDLKLISVVLYKELDNVIKAYIATGIWPILTVRMDDDHVYGQNINIDTLINNRVMPTEPVFILDVIPGQLKTSLVQYTYRFYNKYGITTQLAPLTNKILVIDNNRNLEVGNAEDTTTSKGFALKIKYQNDNFKRMQIFRILYIKENEDAVVSLIYDGYKLDRFNDVGIDPLQVLTMEEFSSLSGIQIIPKIIENNQNYMFASNVTDDTIIKGVEIDTSSNTVSEVSTQVLLSKGGSRQMLPSKTGVDFSNDDYIALTNDISLGRFAVLDYFEDRNINKNIVKNTYNDIFTSSLLRSLRRGETYKYGIVYYDKYGRRSDVLNLGDVTIGNIASNPTTDLVFTENDENSHLSANVCGVRISLPQPKVDGELVDSVIGCLIVRRSSKSIYQKTLLLVALARPIRQPLEYSRDGQIVQSPYYPTGFLTSDHFQTLGYYGTPNSLYGGLDSSFNATSINLDTPRLTNRGLFLIFSSEIDVRRNDLLSALLENNITLIPVQIFNPIEEDLTTLNAENKKQFGGNHTGLKFSRLGVLGMSADEYLSIIYVPKIDEDNQYDLDYLRLSDKNKDLLIYNYYNVSRDVTDANQRFLSEYKILQVADVKIPKWYEGFSNIQYDGENISTGIKQYKQFTTSIDEYTFNNWVSFGLYDLNVADEGQYRTYVEGVDDAEDHRAAQFLYGQDPPTRDYVYRCNAGEDDPRYWWYATYSKGFIGPGPSSLLIALDKTYHPDSESYTDMLTASALGTFVCNIEHGVEFLNSEPDEYVQYFGFGNYFPLVRYGDEYKVQHADGTTNDYMYVFDGDIYITPHEITTLYKTYDFNSKDTLESLLVTNYIPLESKVNTFFDYGMNYLNTQSTVLLYDSGAIEGVVSLNRPAHLYNIIYSNNDVSNDVFSLISTDKNETNTFPHRTYYSEPKTNGEFIDSFNIFKPVAFIDVDSKYGEVTELLTDKNTLYYWQNSAFGKFSVNERSLINDQNGNTIMLGQAGILSRFDYINTRYGMRPYDYSAIAAEGKVYWIDINNRAIVVGNTSSAANLGELLNVLNIINAKIDTDSIPKIDYDLLNNELLCKCLTDGELLIFNIKYNIATSIYNRIYDNIIYIKNHIYGILKDWHRFIKFNYLHNDDVTNLQNEELFLRPVQLSFIVNPATSVTKVFDSQTIIPIKRPAYNGIDYTKAKPEEHNNVVGTFFDGITTSFETDIVDSNTNSIEPHTDREGNIIYSVPRYGNDKWGNRMRGKWLRTYIEQENPHEFFTISHVITKLRQSYS